jgi:glycosyltransferase involved in cell wall biosynthesis
MARSAEVPRRPVLPVVADGVAKRIDDGADPLEKGWEARLCRATVGERMSLSRPVQPKALRIAHLVSSLMNGGMEHFVLRLASAQRKLGHDARVVAIKPGPLEEDAGSLGVPVTVLQRGGKADRIVRGLAALASQRPDIIHAHNTTSLHYAMLGRLVSRGRVVLTDHAQIARVPRAFEWYLTDAAVAVSRDTAQKSTANRVLPEVRVFHNGVDVEPPRRSRAEVRAELGIAADAVVAVHVARFVPLKAQDVVVRALAVLAKGTPAGAAITVIFVGDGPEHVAVERLAGDLGVPPERARFLGYRTDVADLLGASDIFLLPSRTEGLPLSVLEAMTHRLAIVATPVGGVPELCTDGTDALFVPVDDPPALAAAMEKLAGDSAQRVRMGAAAHARALADFSFAAMTERYLDLYREVLSRGPLDRAAFLVARARRQAGLPGRPSVPGASA